MTVVVCGGREWTDKVTIEERLRQLPEDTTLIHGDCRGADRIAGEIGKRLGHRVVAVPAQWDIYGRGAGHIRNAAMVGMNPDLVIAFHEDIEQSKGTRDMVRRSRKAGIPVEIVNETKTK